MQSIYAGKLRTKLRREACAFRPASLRKMLCYIQIHKDKMTNAATHDKQMENLMGTEIPVSVIKNRQLQGINHAANRIDDAAGQKPEKGAVRKCAPQLAENAEADPSHRDIDNRREPFRTGNP